jgi:hypothetical protein
VARHRQYGSQPALPQYAQQYSVGAGPCANSCIWLLVFCFVKDGVSCSVSGVALFHFPILFHFSRMSRPLRPSTSGYGQHSQQQQQHGQHGRALHVKLY